MKINEPNTSTKMYFQSYPTNMKPSLRDAFNKNSIVISDTKDIPLS